MEEKQAEGFSGEKEEEEEVMCSLKSARPMSSCSEKCLVYNRYSINSG